MHAVDDRRQHPFGLAERLTAGRERGAGDSETVDRAQGRRGGHSVASQHRVNPGPILFGDPAEQDVLAGGETELVLEPLRDFSQRRSLLLVITVEYPAAVDVHAEEPAAVGLFEPAEMLPAFEQAKKLMAEHRVPVVVEVILERVTKISMGTDLDGVVEFEELASTGADAPTAISMLD